MTDRRLFTESPQSDRWGGGTGGTGGTVTVVGVGTSPAPINNTYLPVAIETGSRSAHDLGGGRCRGNVIQTAPKYPTRTSQQADVCLLGGFQTLFTRRSRTKYKGRTLEPEGENSAGGAQRGRGRGLC